MARQARLKAQGKRIDASEKIWMGEIIPIRIFNYVTSTTGRYLTYGKFKVTPLLEV